MARNDLFSAPAENQPDAKSAPDTFKSQPLAARMRPRNLDEYAGQSHILGAGQLLRRAIEADRIQSLIFYGAPGTGKTSLAQIIARQTKSKFERLSGVESNVADMRRVLSAAANRLENTGATTILFIDEIHRFNKSQQDILLPDVESGVIRLIGATTHNPFFFVNSPLVSRSQIFELRPLTEDELYALLQRALNDEERGLGYLKIQADENALRHLARLADGDARKALNSLEIAALTTEPSVGQCVPPVLGEEDRKIPQSLDDPHVSLHAKAPPHPALSPAGGEGDVSPGEGVRQNQPQTSSGMIPPSDAGRTALQTGVIHITLAVAEQSIQKKAVVYDGDGDAHYDTISAFIKSMRGSDPDAALYWLAKMIHAGEDPRFIARRIVICAAEDVGLADPMALVLANACLAASEFVGWPEARIPLAEATIYIATANKSNSAYKAIDAALEDVRSGRTIAVPEHLRDGSYSGAKKLGHGVGYEYAHDGKEHFVAQDYLGADKKYYEPTEQGVEKKIKERLDNWRKQKRAGMPKPQS